jgi:ATP-dependent helicase HrpA
VDAQFPAQLLMNGVSFALQYRFEPGAVDDGVTLEVPLLALNQVDAERAEWLVPGLLQEKLLALIRSLPKPLRRQFVPAKDFAAACAEALRARTQGRLAAAAAAELQRMTGTGVPPEAWREEEVPAHLRMNFRIVDEQGAVLATGRDLARLRAGLGERAHCSFSASLRQEHGGRRIVTWDFGDLPEVTEVKREGLRVRAYPVLQDEGDAVSWQWYDDARRAAVANRAGIRRLFTLALSTRVKHLKKQAPGLPSMCAHYLPLGSCGELQAELVEAAVEQVFLHGRPLPRTAEDFQRRLAEGAPALVAAFNELCRLVADILQAYHEVMRVLGQVHPASWTAAVADMRGQLERLVYAGFLHEVPPGWLRHYPRYLKALRIRLDKLRARPDRDAQLQAELEPLWQKWLREGGDSAVEADAQDIPLRWLLEELRVSLFAQELKTLVPVSVKRVQRRWRN